MTSTYAGKHALLVPALTPFDSGYDPDAGRFSARCKKLLAEGTHGLAVFGTTSEANSLSVGERTDLLEGLIQDGVSPETLMPGCGCCALPDTVQLARHAVKLGCTGVLVIPPFFYRVATDEGLVAYFSEVIERVGDTRLRLYLYHFPKMSGLPISPHLLELLLRRYPDTIAGVKDSAGVWEDTALLIKNFPTLDIYSGSEAFLLRNLRAGGAGCISATANANTAAIRSLIDQHDSSIAERLQDEITAVRTAFETQPLIPGLKAFLAGKPGDDSWARLRPPLLSLPQPETDKLRAALAAAGLTI